MNFTNETLYVLASFILSIRFESEREVMSGGTSAAVDMMISDA